MPKLRSGRIIKFNSSTPTLPPKKPMSATVRKTYHGQIRPIIGYRPIPGKGFETISWSKVNLFTSKEEFKRFTKSFNRSTYSKNSRDEKKEVKHSLEECSIDFDQSKVLAIVDRHPFAEYKFTSIKIVVTKLSVSVELERKRQLAAPSKIGSYTAFVIDGVSEINQCSVSGFEDDVMVDIH